MLQNLFILECGSLAITASRNGNYFHLWVTKDGRPQCGRITNKRAEAFEVFNEWFANYIKPLSAFYEPQILCQERPLRRPHRKPA